MTTRAEEIAAEEYPDTNGPDGETIYMEGQRQVFVKGYKQGQQDRWIPVSQFEAPAPGTIMQAGDAMAVQLRHLAEEYRNTMSMRGGSSDMHPSHAEALTAWDAAKEQGFTPTNTEAPTSEGSTTLAPTNTEGNG